MQPLRIFIGYDRRESIAYHVLAHSILERASIPVAIAPLKREHLRAIYWRERGPTESTEFSLTRFLVPYLCEFRGHALFMDCDMLCRCDVGELVAYLDPSKAVHVCQHDYAPKTATKFLNQQQTTYPRKNWSSLMFFNNPLCHALWPAYVSEAPGLDLHRFRWLSDDALIGSLPLTYNWLAGEYPYNPSARIVHFTNGGPWFLDQRDVDYADDWAREAQRMTHSTQVAV